MARQKLTNRRPSETIRVVWQTETGDHTFHVSIGLDPDGYPTVKRPVEVFYSEGTKSMKTGTTLYGTVCDACILISLLLQYGATIDEIDKSLLKTQVAGEETGLSIVGAITKGLKSWATS